MKEFSRKQRGGNRIIGFVPTMGALHDGHLSLIKRAQQDSSCVIASIFVNPKQFGPSEDFAKYPRPLVADTEKLKAAGIHCVFIPEAAEMYPADFSTYINVEGLSDRLEGRARPNHFRGVTTVVMKLLQIVQPQSAYLGRKDAQQARIISRMAADLNLDAEIVVCPIVREHDGLAMSSRNAYLSADDRKAATVLHRALQAAQNELHLGVRDAAQLQSTMRRILESQPEARVDYAEIVDADNFQSVARVSRPAYALLAVNIGKIRLLDNMYIDFSRVGDCEGSAVPSDTDNLSIEL
jgi:pantoate--beta-alanine ligase